jgi:O-antigen/teichoic acid export membrane protein
MKEGRALLEKGGVFAGIDAVGKLLAFAVVAVLSRRVSGHEFGVVVASISAASLIQGVLDGGLGLGLARAVAREDEDRPDLSGAKLTVALPALLPSVFVAFNPDGVLAIPLATLACAATSALLLVPALLAAHRLAFASIALVGPNALLLGLVAVLPSPGAVGVLYAFAACNTICAALTMYPPDVRPRPMPLRAALGAYRRHIAKGVFAITSLAYGRLDTVLLALFGAVTIAGTYGTFYRMMLAGVSLVSWISPLAMRSFVERETLTARLRWLERRLAGVATVLFVALLAAGPPVLQLLTDGATLPAAVFILISLAVFPTILAAPLGSALIMTFRSKILALISTALLGLACLLYLTMIPLFGATGAALASVTVDTCGLIWIWREALGANAAYRGRSDSPRIAAPP